MKNIIFSILKRIKIILLFYKEFLLGSFNHFLSFFVYETWWIYWAFLHFIARFIYRSAAQSFLSLNMTEDIISFPIFRINFLQHGASCGREILLYVSLILCIGASLSSGCTINNVLFCIKVSAFLPDTKCSIDNSFSNRYERRLLCGFDV